MRSLYQAQGQGPNFNEKLFRCQIATDRNLCKMRGKRSKGKGRQFQEDAELRRIQGLLQTLPRLRDKYSVPGLSRRQRKNAEIRSENATANQTNSENDALAQAVAYSSKRFSDLPLSRKTLNSLALSLFTELTDIQRLAIPQALAGRDVLAAAPTGSGKTLAFVVPLIERLWRAKWSGLDGLGALVLSPTRELAMQIFEVVAKFAKFHGFTAGAITGGTRMTVERNVVGRLNILVATPGRLLQHMDQVPDFDCSTLQLLVLDEADRILDMGFKESVDAILANLPKRERQTLLFSATQTKSIRTLGRLSLSDPEYVTVQALRTSAAQSRGEDVVDESAAEKQMNIAGVPSNLTQTYAVVDLEDKLSVAWSFLRTHTKEKSIMFFSSCKQVRFAFEAFRRMRPGIPLLHLHGKMKQLKRAETYKRFVGTRQAALLATDIAARGLDFPSVDWVLQVDCPPDVESYVHRVGRTARYRSAGKALLLLNRGSEEEFVNRLKERKIIPSKATINSKRIVSISKKLSSICASFQEVQYLAKRAVLSYLRALDLRSDAEVFKVKDIDQAGLSASYGLPFAPKVKLRQIAHENEEYSSVKELKKNIYGYYISNDQNGAGKVGGEKQIAGAHETFSDEDSDELLKVKKVHDVDNTLTSDPTSVNSLRKRPRPQPKRIVWNDDEEEVAENESDADSVSGASESEAEGVDQNVESVSKRLKAAAEDIRSQEKQRIQKLRARRKGRRESFIDNDDSVEANLESLHSDHSDSGSDSESDDESYEDSDDVEGEVNMKDQAAIALKILETK